MHSLVKQLMHLMILNHIMKCSLWMFYSTIFSTHYLLLISYWGTVRLSFDKKELYKRTKELHDWWFFNLLHILFNSMCLEPYLYGSFSQHRLFCLGYKCHVFTYYGPGLAFIHLPLKPEMLMGTSAWGHTSVNHPRSQALWLGCYERMQKLCLAGTVQNVSM